MAETDYFITTWQTTVANETITVPTNGSGYIYDIDWGDGNVDENMTGSVVHNYAIAGIYTVKIRGLFPSIYFNNKGDKDKILSIEQWGIIEWKSMAGAFHGCSKLVLNAIDIPNLSLVKTTSTMFYNATSFNGNLSNWDVSKVINMASMFRGCSSFNSDLSNWNVSLVTNMDGMFSGASKFNGDISGWNVSSLTTMSIMFWNATLFNSDLSRWDVSNVINMASSLRGCTSFTRDLSNWKVDAVTNMSAMFYNATSFNSDLSNWNVSKVTNMASMFRACSSFNSDLSNWDVGSVTNMDGMFSGATLFNSDLSNWDVSNVTTMSTMFWSATSFNADISNWNVSKVTNMASMLRGATSFNRDISLWDVSNVANMDGMFLNNTLSTENYDALLKKWSELTLQENVKFHAGSSTYCRQEEARTKLIDQFRWSITDNGQECISTMDINKSTIIANPLNVNVGKKSPITITVQAIDTDGNRITTGGETIRVVSSIGNISETIDNNNGTYTANLLSSISGTATISFFKQEAKSQQTTIVSFYQPLGCSVGFTIQANQAVMAAEGRYKSLEQAENSWVVFDINDTFTATTPALNTEGYYDLEVRVQDTNQKWTEWFPCDPFIIGCDNKINPGISIEIGVGGCFSEIIRWGTAYIVHPQSNTFQIDNGQVFYNDTNLKTVYNGGDQIFRFRGGNQYSFKINAQGVVYDKQFCAS